jgi:sugar lactone lactonase YvrE
MAFAADGTLYVSTDNDQNGAHSAMSGSIWRIDPGAHSAVVIASAIGRPRGLVVLADGRIALTDYMHQVVELLALETIMRLRGGRLRTARSRRSQCWCTSETYEQRCPRSWRLPVRGNA